MFLQTFAGQLQYDVMADHYDSYYKKRTRQTDWSYVYPTATQIAGTAAITGATYLSKQWQREQLYTTARQQSKEFSVVKMQAGRLQSLESDATTQLLADSQTLAMYDKSAGMTWNQIVPNTMSQQEAQKRLVAISHLRQRLEQLRSQNKITDEEYERAVGRLSVLEQMYTNVRTLSSSRKGIPNKIELNNTVFKTKNRQIEEYKQRIMQRMQQVLADDSIPEAERNRILESLERRIITKSDIRGTAVIVDQLVNQIESESQALRELGGVAGARKKLMSTMAEAKDLFRSRNKLINTIAIGQFTALGVTVGGMYIQNSSTIADNMWYRKARKELVNKLEQQQQLETVSRIQQGDMIRRLYLL